MKKGLIKNSVVIYQAKNGAIELRGDFVHETLWATQAQVVGLFGVDQSVVSRHIKNIFKDGEVAEKSNMQKMHIANSDKPVILYSLDVILSVEGGKENGSSTFISKLLPRASSQYVASFSIRPSINSRLSLFSINFERITGRYRFTTLYPSIPADKEEAF